MTSPKLKKVVGDLNESCTDVLETVQAMHGKDVAHLLHAASHADRGLTSVMMLFESSGAPMEEGLQSAIECLHQCVMESFDAGLRLGGKSPSERAALIKTLEALQTRSRTTMLGYYDSRSA